MYGDGNALATRLQSDYVAQRPWVTSTTADSTPGKPLSFAGWRGSDGRPNLIYPCSLLQPFIFFAAVRASVRLLSDPATARKVFSLDWSDPVMEAVS